MTQNIDLNSLTSAQGFKIIGAAADDYSGYSVSKAGDVNGDGNVDFMVGAYRANPSNTQTEAGITYVIFGKTSDFNDLDLTTDLLNTGQGFKITGAVDDDYSGYSVSKAGDVNKDGYDDIIIGAYATDIGSKMTTGTSYILFGKASGFSNINLASTFSESQGFKVLGPSSASYNGFSVSDARDVNGDGYDDIIIGAYGIGDSYVILGKSSGFATIDLSQTDLAATGQGFSILSGESVGFSVSSAGDFNGDGYDDVIIGDPYSATNTGLVYIIFGKASFSTSIDLYELTIEQGFRIYGAYTFDSCGASVSSAGDVNGDGYDDVIIGAYGADPSNDQSGAGISYVIFGKASGFSDIFLKNDLTSTGQGFKILGATKDDKSGRSVSNAGDINKDGYDDLIIGAYSADPSANQAQAGISYIIFGKMSWVDDLYLNSLTSAQGFKILGAIAGDNSGISVSSAGDVNKDGYDDLLIGANLADPELRADAGITYIIFGGESDPVPSAPPTSAPSRPTSSPTLTPTAPTLSPTFTPSAAPTSFPTIKPTIATSSPSELPTKIPTNSPTAEYLTVDISTGGVYTGTSAQENFVMDSSEDTTITGAGGADMFTIMVHPGIITTVTDFNEDDELIDLTSFTNIHSMEDFTITSGSAVINLDDEQKVILQNLSPSDLTADNFIFTPAPENDSDESSGDINGIIIGAAIGGATLFLLTAYCAYAKVTHTWPFMHDDIKESGVEISGATGNPLSDT